VGEAFVWGTLAGSSLVIGAIAALVLRPSLRVIQGNFVAPLVYSKAVNLHPAIVLMAIPAGSEIAGVLGMFLAVPALGVIAATWRTVPIVFTTRPGAVTLWFVQYPGSGVGFGMAILPFIIILYLNGRDVKAAFGLADPQAV
jgi:hypothetical protein